MVLFCGGGFLELTAAGRGGPGPVAGAVVWLQVVDVDAEVERLRRVGVEVGTAVTPTASTWCWWRSPPATPSAAA